MYSGVQLFYTRTPGQRLAAIAVERRYPASQHHYEYILLEPIKHSIETTSNSNPTAASLAAHCHLELPQLHMAPSWECRTSCFASTSAPLAINSSATASSPFEHAMYSGVHLFYTRTPDQQLVANFRLTQISCQPTPLRVQRILNPSSSALAQHQTPATMQPRLLHIAIWSCLSFTWPDRESALQCPSLPYLLPWLSIALPLPIDHASMPCKVVSSCSTPEH